MRGLSHHGFEAFIDWRVKILCAAMGTDPHGDVINSDGLTMKPEPDKVRPVFHGPLTTGTQIVRSLSAPFCHARYALPKHMYPHHASFQDANTLHVQKQWLLLAHVGHAHHTRGERLWNTFW